LMLAAQNGHKRCALELIKAKADLEKQTKIGNTALIFACQSGHEQCALELIKAKANVNYAKSNGFTALMLSCKKRSRAVRSRTDQGGGRPLTTQATTGALL
jgi:ankyrin repeat protein